MAKAHSKRSRSSSRGKKSTTQSKSTARRKSSSTTSSQRKRSAHRAASRGKGKVGSDPEAIRLVGGKGDFGASESQRRERDYVSQETKRNDPGAAPERVKVGDSARESGAGAPDSGPGSGSGGDLDPDITGVGFGGAGIAQAGPTRAQGADMTTGGGSDTFAARGPKGHPPDGPARRQRVKGSTVDRSGGDLSTTGGGLDASSVTNPQARNDDSFAADINEDEARGAENSPSDRGG